MTISELLSETDAPQRVAVLADTVDDGQHVVESTFGGLITAKSHRGIHGFYRLGDHRVIVVTPRSRYRTRGFQFTAVLIDSWSAYTAALPTLGPSLVGVARVRWFDRNGELPDRPERRPA